MEQEKRTPKTTPSAQDLPTSLLDVYTTLPYFKPTQISRLHKLCGTRFMDLLFHFPTNCVDRTYTPTIADAIDGKIATLQVTVKTHRKGHNRKSPYKILVSDGTDYLELIFFNAGPWIKNAFPQDKDVIISGRIERLLTGTQMMHPDFWPANRLLEDVAIMEASYPLTAGVAQKTMQRAIHTALELARKPEQAPTEWLPEELVTQNKWQPFATALCQMHQPKSVEDTQNMHNKNRCRLAFDELYAWQLALRHARKNTKGKDGIQQQPSTRLRPQFLQGLPFALTGDQQQVLAEIDTDMAAKTPMLRLVQGDVGSGKTVVAFAALLNAIEAGNQGVLMAPTEILAQQHFNNAQNWLEALGVRIAFLAGKVKAAEKRKIKTQLAAGEIDLIIGTHALIQDDVILQNCGLVVIDEQHRFGVRQRLALAEGPYAPDLLVMTATPIPRTLALTAYGDMDISLIREKPPGRLPIETTANPISKLPDIAQALRRILKQGEQAYWVCPLVDESEKIDLAAATERFETLQKLYPNDVALLHGKMKPAEKEEILAAFRDGKFKILVSTTVVEVGVDVPQATVMVIEHAERFGLAQLHQLRGRVGRGSGKSHCILLYAKLSQIGRERIEALRHSDDGFYLAEKDLELRGPGEILGTAQSGHIFTRIADLSAHKDMLPMARELAEKTLAQAHTPQKAAALNWLLTAFEKDEAVQFINAG